MYGCMTTMHIDNHPLTQRRLQFIGISVNKLTLKSINIIQTSNNYNIVSSFICWNQNIVHMKILDTSFKMPKRILLLAIFLTPASPPPPHFIACTVPNVSVDSKVSNFRSVANKNFMIPQAQCNLFKGNLSLLEY